MKPILILAIVILCGCGSRDQINDGAQRAVYIGSVQHMFDKIPEGVHRSSVIVRGYFNTQDKTITIGEQAHEWRLVEVWTHELVRHAITDWLRTHDQWDPDAFLRQYEGRGLNFNLYPEPW